MKSVLISLLFLAPLTLSAQSVDILYRGDGYTPPLYEGGTLWSNEATLTLFALPQGLGDPRSLNYRWSQGTTVLGSQSGVGKNTLTFTDTLFSKPQIFAVEVLKGDEEVLAQSWITVSPTSPSLLVYEKSPLYGLLFNHEVSGTYKLEGEEVTFAAFPLFFSTLNRQNNFLTYSWRSKGGTDSSESTVTYRIPESTKGQASVSVEAQNPSTIKQAAERSFLIQFGNEK